MGTACDTNAWFNRIMRWFKCFFEEDMANPNDSKSIVYLSHEVQKVMLPIRW